MEPWHTDLPELFQKQGEEALLEGWDENLGKIHSSMKAIRTSRHCHTQLFQNSGHEPKETLLKKISGSWKEQWALCVLSFTLCKFFFKFYLFLFIYLFYFWLCWVFVSVRGLSLVVASGGHSSSRCAGLSLSWPLLLRSTGSRCAGSVVVAHGPSCSAACGILPDQGSNPCPLHWQADSQPLRHQGSPYVNIKRGPLSWSESEVSKMVASEALDPPSPTNTPTQQQFTDKVSFWDIQEASERLLRLGEHKTRLIEVSRKTQVSLSLESLYQAQHPTIRKRRPCSLLNP